MKATPEELKDFVIKRNQFLANEHISDLHDYIKKSGLSVTEFALMLGKNRTYIYELINGEKSPSKHFMEELMLITGGKIRTPLDIIKTF